MVEIVFEIIGELIFEVLLEGLINMVVSRKKPAVLRWVCAKLLNTCIDSRQLMLYTVDTKSNSPQHMGGKYLKEKR